jgi:hypothetical protein
MRLDPDSLRDMKVNIHIPEHHNPRRICVQTIHRYIRMRADGKTFDLSKVELLCSIRWRTMTSTRSKRVPFC